MESSGNPFESPESGRPQEPMAPSASRKRGRLFPPPLVSLLAAALLFVMFFVRIRNVAGDFAVSNILAFLSFLAFSAVIWLWFLFFSGYSRLFRLGVFTVVFGGLLLLGLMFRVEHVSGELVPTFRPRWAKSADELLERPRVEVAAGEVKAEAWEATSGDFPQFLGPDRNGYVADIKLAKDWESTPPRQLWRQPIGAGWSAFSVVNDFAVTLEQRGDDEFVTCYEVPTGKLVWAHATLSRHETIPGGIGPRSTPTLHEGRVYALGATGELLCLDGASGAVIWRDNLLDRTGVRSEDDVLGVAWGRASSPLIVDELVVVPMGGPKEGSKTSLAAFHQMNGAVMWEAGDQQVSYSSPILATLAGVRQVISVNETNVTGHDPESGKILWTIRWPGDSTQNASVSQPVPLSPNRLLLTKGYGQGAAVYELTSAPDQSLKVREIWSDRTLLKTKFTNVVVHEGYAYGLSDSILECVAIESGERQWKRGRFGQGQILGVGDVLLIQAESGEVVMVALSPDEYRELTRFAALDGKTWNNLCLSGRRLLVRNAEEAACYELPVE